jgi:hypothetical protein
MNIIFTCRVHVSVFFRQGRLWETWSSSMWVSCKVRMMLEQYGSKINFAWRVCLPRVSNLIVICHIMEMDFISLKFAYFVHHCAMNAETNEVTFLNVLPRLLISVDMARRWVIPKRVYFKLLWGYGIVASYPPIWRTYATKCLLNNLKSGVSFDHPDSCSVSCFKFNFH